MFSSFRFTLVMYRTEGFLDMIIWLYSEIVLDMIIKYDLYPTQELLAFLLGILSSAVAGFLTCYFLQRHNKRDHQCELARTRSHSTWEITASMIKYSTLEVVIYNWKKRGRDQMHTQGGWGKGGGASNSRKIWMTEWKVK